MSTAEVFRWTADAFEVAGQVGIFGDERVELVEGEVFYLAPLLPPHAEAVRRLSHFLVRSLDPGRLTIGGNDPVRLDERNEPLPDVWLAEGGEGTYAGRHPSPAELRLAVEVSDTTLGRDQRRKLPVYAAFGVPVVWVVALSRERVFEYREPDPESRAYALVTTLVRGQSLTVPGTDLVVAVDLLLGA
jgi:Uma2 family endonuclease